MDDKILKELKKMQKQIDSIDAKLTKHRTFIESFYNPLSKSIDRFKKIFK